MSHRGLIALLACLAGSACGYTDQKSPESPEPVAVQSVAVNAETEVSEVSEAATATTATATGGATATAGVANPASRHCLAQGFETDSAMMDGQSVDLCVDPVSGAKCPLWDFYRGECGLTDQASDESGEKLPE